MLDEVAGPLNQQQREVAEILVENGIRLQQLIEDLLSFSAAQARNTITVAEPVAMDKVVEAVCEDHMLAAKAKEISLRPSLGHVVVCGDRDKLRVIVDNLLSNAIKYSPCGGVVTVALRRDGDLAVLDVRDTGPGILPVDRPRLFEAFIRATPRITATSRVPASVCRFSANTCLPTAGRWRSSRAKRPAPIFG